MSLGIAYLDYPACDCNGHYSLPSDLVLHGLFPTAPSQPRVAISIDLLEMYQHLVERSGIAVDAFTTALNDFYSSRGYQIQDSKVIITWFQCDA